MKKILLSAMMCLGLLAFGACSSDDDSPSVSQKLTGQWYYEANPDEYVTCYSDGGLGWNLPSYRMFTYGAGTYTYSDNNIRYELYGESRLFENLNEQSSYSSDMRGGVDLTWVNEDLIHVEGTEYYMRRRACNEYWKKEELVGVWKGEGMTIALNPSWEMQVRIEAQGAVLRGGFLHVVNPEEHAIMLSRQLNEKGKPYYYTKYKFEWKDGKNAVTIGGYTFTKSTSDWKSVWNK